MTYNEQLAAAVAAMRAREAADATHEGMLAERAYQRKLDAGVYRNHSANNYIKSDNHNAH